MRPQTTTALPPQVAREQQAGPLLQPRHVPELVDDAAVLFRSALRPLLLSSVIVLVPISCLQLVLALLVADGDITALEGLGGLLQIIVFIVGALLLACAQVWIAYERWRGNQPDVREAFLTARPLLLRMAGMLLLYVLALVGMSITVIGIPLAVHFLIAWSLALPALVIEGLRPRAALGRSRALVRGHWWRVVGLVVVLAFVQTVVAFGFRIPTLFFGADLFNPGDDVPRIVTIMEIIGDSAMRIVLTPLAVCATVLLYLDQRVRTEGLDLEQQAYELGFRNAPPVPTPPPPAGSAS